MPSFAMSHVLRAALLLMLFSAPLFAQAQAPAAELQTGRARIEAIKSAMSQIETALRNREPNEAELLRQRQQTTPLVDELRELIDETQPKADQAKSRLEQLGPKPDAKAPAESPETAKDRQERGQVFAEADETIRLGRATLLQAEQLQTEISDRRRQLFAKALFARGSSPLNPELWLSALVSLPSDINAFVLIFGGWLSAVARALTDKRALVLVLALAAAVLLYVARARLLPEVARRLSVAVDTGRLRVLLVALAHLVAAATPAALASWLLYTALDTTGLLPGRIQPVVWAMLGGIAFVVFINALADALFSPHDAARRLIGVMDRTARVTVRIATVAAAVLVIGKASEAMLQSIAAGLSLSILVKAGFALAFASALALTLLGLRDDPDEEECSLGPYVPVDGAKLAPLRIAGWIAAVLIAVSAIFGFVAFAGFLSEQVIWVGTIGALYVLLKLLIDSGIEETLSGDGKLARGLQTNVGLRKSALEQFGVVASGFAKLLLMIVMVMLVLAPWGVESADLVSSLKAAFFGFKVGDVTISLSAIIIAGAMLALGLAATKALQRWLDVKLLPATELDTGLRNSIKTAAGYVGFLAAIALAVSSLGLSLERLTIVAGALSVGIGFGLQSVVSNFVSGLILLWERPIRVGDQIVVGEGEGIVRRINVRSTEIETFDRSTIIVPNSNLVSGVVKNRVRTDRSGRVVIQLSVPRNSDPGMVRKVLLDCANANREVLSEPPPRVFFRKINETLLDFELFCVVPEVDSTGIVASDLHFEIFRRLGEAGIGLPEREITVKGLDEIEDTLDDIADALESERGLKPASAPAPATTAKDAAKPSPAPVRKGATRPAS